MRKQKKNAIIDPVLINRNRSCNPVERKEKEGKEKRKKEKEYRFRKVMVRNRGRESFVVNRW